MKDINLKREKNTNHFLCSYKIQKRMSTVSGFDETRNMQTGKSVNLNPQNSFDKNLKEGQIRLLSQLDRITYVVLLRRWEEDSFVVMTFSHYDFPATDEEFKPEFDGGMYLNTLQAWNTRTLQVETLKKSWLIGVLPDSDCADAWDFWEHLMTGRDLKADLLEKTGLPITLPDDPRIQYMKEELSAFNQLDDTELTEESNMPGWFNRIELPPLWQDEEIALAAGDEKQDFIAECTPYGYDEFVSIVFSLRKKTLSVKINTPNQRVVSHTFDSWELITEDCTVLASIKDGACIVRDLESFHGKCALRNPANRSIVILEKKTESLHPSGGYRFPSFRYLAFAALLLVVCGLVFYHEGENKHLRVEHYETTTNYAIDYTKYTQQFRRGAELSDASVPRKNREESEPLAYLADRKGSIEILRRGGEEKIAPSSCKILYSGDIVILADNASAKFMYKDAIFNVAGPMEYKIKDPDPTIIGQSGTEEKPLEPVATTRGKQGLKPSIVSPKVLLATVVAPITRAGENGINVFSPKGASCTDKPVIWIGGDPKVSYNVSVRDLEGNMIGTVLSMKGGTKRPWTDFTNSPIVEDEIYTLRVMQDGKIVNDINNASFWLLSKQEQEKVSIALKYVESVKSEQEKAFFRASAFYMNGCYAEAYAIVNPLADKYPETALYQNFVQLTKNALKVK